MLKFLHQTDYTPPPEHKPPPSSPPRIKGFNSIGIIIAGALVARARDLSFNAYAYTIVFIKNICK